MFVSKDTDSDVSASASAGDGTICYGDGDQNSEASMAASASSHGDHAQAQQEHKIVLPNPTLPCSVVRALVALDQYRKGTRSPESVAIIPMKAGEFDLLVNYLFEPAERADVSGYAGRAPSIYDGGAWTATTSEQKAHADHNETETLGLGLGLGLGLRLDEDRLRAFVQRSKIKWDYRFALQQLAIIMNETKLQLALKSSFPQLCLDTARETANRPGHREYETLLADLVVKTEHIYKFEDNISSDSNYSPQSNSTDSSKRSLSASANSPDTAMNKPYSLRLTPRLHTPVPGQSAPEEDSDESDQSSCVRSQTVDSVIQQKRLRVGLRIPDPCMAFEIQFSYPRPPEVVEGKQSHLSFLSAPTAVSRASLYTRSR